MFSTFLPETNLEPPTKISVSLQKKTSVSTPISIPKRSSVVDNAEYELNLNFFNPSKMSPPDCWKNRLEQRMKKLYELNTLDKE
jgi:hypothetical protein